MKNDIIKVCTDTLDSIALALTKASGRVSDASSALADIHLSSGNGANRGTNSGCSLSVKGSGISGSTVGGALREYRNALSWYSDYIGQLSGKIIRVKSLFEEAESNIKGVFSEDLGNESELDEVLLRILGKAGYFGSLLSGALSLRDWNAENIAKFAAGAANTTAKWYKSNRNLNIVARSSDEFANNLRNNKLIGWDRFYKSGELSRAASKGDAFRANVSTKWGQSIKKPGTWIISGISAAFDNYAEYKTGAITSDRAVVEWAAETAGSVALTTGATVLVGAGLAAAGFAAAPAFLVGAAAVVAVVAVDAVWANTIGKLVGSKDKNEGIVETAGWVVGEGYDFVKGLFGKTGAIKASAGGNGS